MRIKKGKINVKIIVFYIWAFVVDFKVAINNSLFVMELYRTTITCCIFETILCVILGPSLKWVENTITNLENTFSKISHYDKNIM